MCVWECLKKRKKKVREITAKKTNKKNKTKQEKQRALRMKGIPGLLLLLFAVGVWTQKLPTRDEELFQMQIRDKSLFHDSSVIPDGAEINGYLFRDTPKRYYIVVEEDNTPLSVTVTPCDAPLEWKLSLQELPEESSGEGSGEAEPLEQQKQQVISEEGPELFSYKGNDVESYMPSSSPSGLYQLELISTEKDTHFKVYATTTPESDQPYPELPYDPRVDVTSLGRTTVTLAWKPSPTGSLMKQPIQYCVVINKEHNFKSLCAVEAKMNADDAFMMAPKPGLDFSPFDFSHFGFPSENDSGKEHPLMSKSTATKSRLYAGKQKVDLQKVCIGNKNIFTVSDLKPDLQYYFDIFAVNTYTNMSTAYVGTFAKTKEEAKQKTLELKDGKVTDVFIKRKGSKFLTFAPVSSYQKVMFYIHSCLDAIQIQVRRDGKVLLSQNVEGVRQFQLRGKPKAMYLIRLRGSRKGASMLKILATTRPNKQPFPSLPEDTRIKAFDKLRTCTSATVAWLGTQERNKFCIYKKEVDENYNEEQRKREQNQCMGPDTRKKFEKVLCKYFHSQNLQKAVTTETIKGLEPGRSYLLDVYVVGHGGHSVKYQSKLVKTRKFC
ncbi:protein NDNF-like isoform X1 [Acipenser oxyrinchus oxyrinchus]|uniref:Protein NDNF n=1 Tax=Acipenser oxyrinchus oxyrinchus TaxID=40147 RepID=A0AAD8GIP4_ACIOX|nr:protein NDNF-like isoform X1 [Acipenser oxyrinchus oxyrinchus]